MCPLRSQQFIDKADEAIKDWYNGGKVANNSQTSKFVYKVDGEFKPSENIKPFHLNHNERFGVICALMGLYNQDKDKKFDIKISKNIFDKLDKIEAKLDTYEAKTDEKIDKKMSEHIKIYHKGA